MSVLDRLTFSTCRFPDCIKAKPDGSACIDACQEIQREHERLRRALNKMEVIDEKAAEVRRLLLHEGPADARS